MAGGELSGIDARWEPTFLEGPLFDIFLMEDAFMGRGFANQHSCIIN